MTQTLLIFHFLRIGHHIKDVLVNFVTKVAIKIEVERSQFKEEKFEVMEIFDCVILYIVQLKRKELNRLVLLPL